MGYKTSHMSQEWYWVLEKSLKSDYSLKIFIPVAGTGRGLIANVRHAKTHAIRVSITQIRSFWYTHACGPFHSLKSSF